MPLATSYKADLNTHEEYRMKRVFLFLCCLNLTGCVGFNDYYLDDMYGHEYVVENYSPCQPAGAVPVAPRVVPLGPGVVPVSAQVNAPPQTREPELLAPMR
jgi:hypothetical protein